MAQSQSGKWVSRVGSTGGGRNYRSRRPLNFYGVIAIIVVLGLLSIFWARHEYKNSASPSLLPPLAGTTSYVALGFDVCGTLQSPLPAQSHDHRAAQRPVAQGVVQVAPTTKAQAGTNANVAALAAGYPGLTITSTKLALPASGTTKAISYQNGEACPAGTPDAGKTGSVVIARWSSFADEVPDADYRPFRVRLTANSLVTVGFLPSGTTPKKPPQTTITAMLVAAQSGSTTPTTAPATTTTTPATTTTAAATTTTG